MSDYATSPDMIVLHPADNVATALKNLAAGGPASLAGPEGRLQPLALRDQIKLGHKAALRNISKGELAIKHGVPFGRATSDIAVGEHVHIQNIASLSQETDLMPRDDRHD